MRRRLFLLVSVLTALVPPSFAWDYEGHRAVNKLALAALPPEFPAFVRTPEAQERIAFLSGEPDRWRNVPDLPVRHENAPNHYIDLEDLAWMELTPEQLPEFRHVFTGKLALAQQQHPERFPAIEPDKNKDHTRELIGYLPWSIAESYGRLKAAFTYLKTFEENGAGTPEEIANAQANVVYLMGVMGHYVGDGAQPLHTTRHHNGWVGENPNGYTTWNKFHSWIDGDFLKKTGGVDLARIVTAVKPAQLLNARAAAGQRDPIFSQTLAYLLEQHALVEPLYQLEKSGKLKADRPESREGRAFIEGQLLRGGNMLASLWYTAWRDSAPDPYLRGALLERKLNAASAK
jgi:hypothetical protein